MGSPTKTDGDRVGTSAPARITLRACRSVDVGVEDAGVDGDRVETSGSGSPRPPRLRRADPSAIFLRAVRSPSGREPSGRPEPAD